MIIGAHLPNGAITEGDYSLLRQWRPPGVILMPYHTPADVHNLRAACGPTTLFVGRLPDSNYPGRIPSFGDYAAQCEAIIRPLHNAGVCDFVLDNEPQWLQGWGPAAQWQWQAYIADVVPALRRRLADHPDIRIGFPGLSWPNWDAWLEAASRVVGLFDFIACHSYWQAPGDRYNPGFGANAAALHHWRGDKPIYITEFATSIGETTPKPSPAQIEAAMVADYPGWLDWARGQPYILGAFAFIVGGSPEWAHFRITAKVASVLAHP